MSFFIKLSSVFFFAGVFGAGIRYSDFPSGGLESNGIRTMELSAGIRYTGRNDPMEYLTDTLELQNESDLENLAEENVPQTKTLGIFWTPPKVNSGINKPIAKPSSSWICPNKIMNFNGRTDVRFVLYNKNYPQGVDIREDRGVGKLLPTTQTKFLIHGFLNSYNSKMAETIKDAYMYRQEKMNEDYNVIVVDWSKGSGSWLSKLFHCIKKADIVPKVGEAVADFVLDMVEKQRFNVLYVSFIGHSLGAHIAGIAGKKLAALNYHVPFIVGLDPARPGYEFASEDQRLAPTDAIYVEVLHTSPGRLGLMEPLGTADYYANYGLDWTWLGNVRQPNCFTSSCSHALAFELFAETVRDPQKLEGVQCDSLEQMKSGRCGESGTPVYTYLGGPDMRWAKQAGIFQMISKNKKTRAN